MLTAIFLNYIQKTTLISVNSEENERLTNDIIN